MAAVTVTRVAVRPLFRGGVAGSGGWFRRPMGRAHHVIRSPAHRAAQDQSRRRSRGRTTAPAIHAAATHAKHAICPPESRNLQAGRHENNRQVRSQRSAGQTVLTLSDGNACGGEARRRVHYGAFMLPESPAHARPVLLVATADCPYSADSRTKGCGSICVSFTPVHSSSRATVCHLSALVRNGRGRW